jgi:hypothetical protein
MLQAEGESVMLAWAPDSPLARQFRRGSMVNLVADYQSADGDVSGERLASSQVDTSRNAVVFTLPEQLGRVPTGNVCLRLISDRRQAIPLRIVAVGQSSDAFRFAEWEERAVNGTTRRDLTAVTSAVEQNLTTLAGSASEFRNWQDARGIQTIEQCNDIRATYDIKSPDTAIAEDKRGVESRRQCVSQVGGEARWMNSCSGCQLEAAALASDIVASLMGRPQLARAREMQGDVATHKDVLPLREYLLDVRRLGMTESTRAAIRENKGVIDGPIAAAIVSAYNVCLDEAGSQFRQSYDAWQAELNTPIAEERTAVLQEECIDVFEGGQRTAERIRDQELRLATLRSEIDQLSAVPSLAAVKNRSLIGEDCRP